MFEMSNRFVSQLPNSFHILVMERCFYAEPEFMLSFLGSWQEDEKRDITVVSS